MNRKAQSNDWASVEFGVPTGTDAFIAGQNYQLALF